ncbi:MAG: TRCF domain-containing protein, partial [Planctomycetia bacterium]
RYAVETRIVKWDDALIRHAIQRELNRGGQVYFVHNRVHDIRSIEDRILKAVPEAKSAIIHGQMPEDQIEDGMLKFMDRRADVLLATTIIESGLDIPNANTIFINEGDKYGLADLHQLRGRVGRSSQRAYCYVIVDEARTSNPEALKRLKAIEEYSELGSGFQIALRDLEIRGAGNMLGSEQSGHIAAVGYELYCQLLENAVRTLQRQPLRSFLDVTVELPWKAYVPHDYMPGERHRVDAYRRLARLRSVEEVAEFRREFYDRFGKAPLEVENLLDLTELRILAQYWQVEAARPNDQGFLALACRHPKRAEKLARVRGADVVLVDAKTLYVRVAPAHRNALDYARTLKRVLQPA